MITTAGILTRTLAGLVLGTGLLIGSTRTAPATFAADSDGLHTDRTPAIHQEARVHLDPNCAGGCIWSGVDPGTHRQLSGAARPTGQTHLIHQAVRVHLDPNCPSGCIWA